MSTLRIDRIQITVQPPLPPSFSEDLFRVVLTVGVWHEWTLPEINEGSSPLLDVIVEPEQSLETYLDYNAVTRSISFNGDASSVQLAGKFGRITVTLINSTGDEVSYTQTV